MIRDLIIAGVLCATMALPSDASEKPKSQTYETPQECFRALVAAEEKRDQKTFVGCLAPESQKRMALETVYASLEGRMVKGKDAEELAKMMRPVADALAKHGLTREATRDIKPGKKPEERRKAEEAILPLIKDPAGLLVDTMVAFDQAMGIKPGRTASGKTLTDVKIDGDKATGVVVIKGKFSERKEPVSFVKIDKGWRVLFEPQVRKKKDEEKKSNEIAFRTTVAALAKELQADPKAMNKKYEDKVIEVEGYVLRANKYLASDIGLIGVKVAPDRAEAAVRCRVGPADKAWSFGPGQKVKIVGRFLSGSRAFGIDIRLGDCTLTPLEANPTRKVTSKDLTAEFAKGEDAVREKYFGKARTVEFIVEGTVADVRRDMFDDDLGKKRLLVVLSGSGGITVNCRVEEATYKATKNGDKVKMKGTCNILDFNEKEKRLNVEYAFVLEKD